MGCKEVLNNNYYSIKWIIKLIDTIANNNNNLGKSINPIINKTINAKWSVLFAHIEGGVIISNNIIVTNSYTITQVYK